MIERFRHILFLGAHPDDEMGCAGTIARLSESEADVEVLTFSDCEDLIPDGFTRDDLVDEWRKATTLLGVERKNLTLWDVPNRRFPENRQVILDALDRVRRLHWDRPFELVLVPSPADAHQDHAQVAAEAIRVFKQTTILGYELPLNAVRANTLNAFVRLYADDITLKRRHAAIYRSQGGKPYMDPAYIEGLARVRGVQAGVDFAEAFEVIRWVL